MNEDTPSIRVGDQLTHLKTGRTFIVRSITEDGDFYVQSKTGKNGHILREKTARRGYMHQPQLPIPL